MAAINAGVVKEARDRLALTQQDLADRAGTSLFTIQRIERGEGSARPKTIRGVAHALGLDVEELTSGKGGAPLPESEPQRRFQPRHLGRTNINRTNRFYGRHRSYSLTAQRGKEACEYWERRLEAEDLQAAEVRSLTATFGAVVFSLEEAARAELRDLKEKYGEEPYLIGRSILAPLIEKWIGIFLKAGRIDIEMLDNPELKEALGELRQSLRDFEQNHEVVGK